MAETGQVYTIADYVTLWVGEGGASIHIKTREPHGDPVELGDEETKDLIETLTKLLAEIR